MAKLKANLVLISGVNENVNSLKGVCVCVHAAKKIEIAEQKQGREREGRNARTRAGELERMGSSS